jgi:hypothetical protein
MFASEGKSVHVVAFGNGYQCDVVVGKYSDNSNTSVILWTQSQDEDGSFADPLCTLSVNTGDALPEGHFYLKDWSENFQIARNKSVQDLMTTCEEHAPYFSGYVLSRCHILK